MIAFVLPPYSAVIVAVALILALRWLRKPGRGGIVGQRVRSSDHLAWEDAVADKRRELEELLKLEPKE